MMIIKPPLILFYKLNISLILRLQKKSCIQSNKLTPVRKKYSNKKITKNVVCLRLNI